MSSSLHQQIDADLQQAMREQDEVAKLALRAVKTALTRASKESAAATQDQDAVIAIIQHEAKQRREAAAEFERVGADERADQERAELSVLERYLPRQLTAEEIEVLVRQTIAETGASSPRDMGRVMPVVMDQVSGRADGKAVSQIVRRLLAAGS